MRRVLRIWPIYYLYIAVTAITLWLLMKENIVQNDLIYYIFFGANIPFILNGGLMAISHMWSIGVEEQFYLFWPWLFKQARHVAKKITFIVVGLLVLRVVGYILFKYFDLPLLFRIVQVNRFDCMGLGGFAAILYYRKSPLLKQLTSIPIQIITLVAFLLMAVGKFRFWLLVDHQLAAIFTALLILANVYRSNPVLNLENKMFNFFGKISYGLYVYHPLIIFATIPVVEWMTSDYWTQAILLFIIAFIFSVLVSHLSYQYFEKPFLKLKGRFAIIKSSADAPNK
jgi:peptidoglycan/LPS O-acetylase OafA/YrhL